MLLFKCVSAELKVIHTDFTASTEKSKTVILREVLLSDTPKHLQVESITADHQRRCSCLQFNAVALIPADRTKVRG